MSVAIAKRLGDDALPRLVDIFKTGGRPAVLAALQADAVGIVERQALATAVARHVRGNDAPEAVALTQPAVAPLLVGAEGGLCNKLRCLLSYREVARDARRHLIVVWTLGAFCDTHFDELFEPIDGVTVLKGHRGHTAIEEMLIQMGMPFSAVPGEFGCHPAILASEREVSMWRVLRPRAELAAAIAENVSRCGPRFVATHIRRTDFLQVPIRSHQTPSPRPRARHQRGCSLLAQLDHAPASVHSHSHRHASSPPAPDLGRQLFGVKTSDASFNHFLRQHLSTDGVNAYLATDNAITQRHFALICAERYRTLKPISTDVGSLRHTSVADAVVDMFTCVASEAFMGTAGSSFSDAIWSLRLLHRTASSDQHHFDRPPSTHTQPDAVETCGLLLRLPLTEGLLRNMPSSQRSDDRIWSVHAAKESLL